MSTFLTISEVASQLRVNDITIRRAIKNKKLSAVKIGSAYRIGEDMLEAYIQRQTLKAKKL